MTENKADEKEEIIKSLPKMYRLFYELIKEANNKEKNNEI